MQVKKLSAVALSALMATTAMLPMSAFAQQTPSVEYTGGDGSNITHLYLIANDENLANNNTVEYNQTNAKVQVPVAINYVAQANGNILGPADEQAQIRNFSGFPVNVANIKVNAGTNVTLVNTAEAADTADEIYLQMKPNSGTTVAMADFTASATESATGLADGTGKRPDAGAEWNIAAAQSGVGTNAAVASVLNLNSLSGKIGGFGQINPSSQSEIGQIEWTVKPGTYSAPVNYGNVVQSWDTGEVPGTVTATLYDSGAFVVSGEGPMKDYSVYGMPPWMDTCKTAATSVIIEDGVTHLGDRAFFLFSNITSATIADSVSGSLSETFANCTSLSSIELPDSIDTIGMGTFAYCTSLTQFTISDSVTSIGADAFRTCTNLSDITVGNSVTSIGDNAFSQCTSLASITLPSSVVSMSETTFSLSNYLSTINVGWAENEVEGAPWGATNGGLIINYNYGA